MNRLLLLLSLCLAWLIPSPASASGAIHIYVGAPGRNKVPIALPSPVSDHPKAAEFYSVVQRDLVLSGWFEVIEEAAYVEPKGTGIRPGQFNFDDWDVPGAVALAKMGLSAKGADQLRAEVWVYDVPGRRRLRATALTVDAQSWRSLAHRMANEIIYQVTGQKGPFNTRFTYARKTKTGKEIGVVDFDGHAQRGITSNGSINLKPIWSPSGTELSFTSYREEPDLYVADLKQGKIRRLSNRMGINVGGVWSPDRTKMALTLAPDGNPTSTSSTPSPGKRSSD